MRSRGARCGAAPTMPSTGKPRWYRQDPPFGAREAEGSRNDATPAAWFGIGEHILEQRIVIKCPDQRKAVAGTSSGRPGEPDAPQRS